MGLTAVKKLDEVFAKRLIGVHSFGPEFLGVLCDLCASQL